MSSGQNTFYAYFKENMEYLGLPAPDSLFANVTTATATISAIAIAIEKFDASVTIAELVGAGTLPEILLVVGGCTAAFYVGACIGSLAVATGRWLSSERSIGDMLACATNYGIPTSAWLQKTLVSYPEICDIHQRSVSKIAMRKAQWARRAA